MWVLAGTLSPEDTSEWARHFRQHYCPDNEIDALREGTGLTRSEFLRIVLFPDEARDLGPAVRSGDFAEVLVSDVIEHLWNYWIPRGRFETKSVRNESTKGIDILGFKSTPSDDGNPEDELVSCEVKAQLTGNQYKGKLAEAIADVAKATDVLRRGQALNAAKRRLLLRGEADAAKKVQRFQNPTDHPYVHRLVPAVVLSDAAWEQDALLRDAELPPDMRGKVSTLLVLRGTELMKLVHALYEKAADEA